MDQKRIEALVGRSAVVQKEVEPKDTAVLYGERDLPELLATPAYVALMIQAATEAVAGQLQLNETTIGYRMSFVHEEPTWIGLLVSIKATIVKVEDRKIFFEIEAYDEFGTIGHGTHERILVNRDSLKKKAKERIHESK